MKMMSKSTDPLANYIIGRIHDYKTNNKKEALKHYKKAFNADPSNLQVLKEYLLHLEINEVDKNESKRVAKLFEKIPRDEKSELWWTTALEVGYTYGPKSKKGQAIFKEMLEKNPLSSLLKEYWDNFSNVPRKEVLDDWSK